MPKLSYKRKSHKRKSHKRKSHKRNSRSHGGSYSMGPSFIVPGSQVVGRNLIGPDCLAAQRPGHLSGLGGFGGNGLPGMSGGRYGISLDGAPLFGLGGVSSIPCEGSRPNSLNIRGGAQGADIRGGGQGADMMTYEAPKAGYQNNMVTLGGRPLMIQAPYAHQAMNRACLTTGGRRHRRGKKSKKSKKSRKHKK